MSSTVSPQQTADSAGVDCTRTQIDPRGPRFGGAVTTVVLALALVLVGTTAGTVLVAWQTLVFALGAIVGLHAQPYGIVFRKVIRPRLSPPAELEDAAPPRFAQAVGLAFLVVALIASLTGVTVVATVAIAFALAAAFLNAAFDFCLGCEMYLLGRRLAHR
jgi:Domain of unknown function (DUF4395)